MSVPKRTAVQLLCCALIGLTAFPVHATDMGTLFLSVNIESVVSIDGEEVGIITPESGLKVPITFGEHELKLKLKHSGSPTWRRSITVSKREQTVLRFALPTKREVEDLLRRASKSDSVFIDTYHAEQTFTTAWLELVGGKIGQARLYRAKLEWQNNKWTLQTYE
jgi:hypothetical protein